MNSLIVLGTVVCGQFGYSENAYKPTSYDRSTLVIREQSFGTGYTGSQEIDAEIARRMRIDNWKHRIKTKWQINDEYQEREKSRLNYLDRLERRITAMERSKELTARYIELMGKNP